MRWETRWQDSVAPDGNISERWNDHRWRSIWLRGLTDEELSQLTPYQKGHLLPAYVWLGHGAELYGIEALNYQNGHTLAALANLDLGQNPSPATYIAIGNAHRLMAYQNVLKGQPA